jgi:chorismate mutase/prephenate dehydratase
MDDRLKPLREAIDGVDRRIVELLNERARLATEVGRIKQETAAPVYRPEREAQVLERVAQLSQGPLEAAQIHSVYREVIAACRGLERPIAVSYLGPAGTFSELALRKQFGSGVTAEPCGSIDEVVRNVEAGTTDYGIVPIENSTEGAVARTLDLLLATPLSIIAEVPLPVHHNLLTRTGDLRGVRRICAHSQALAQCASWLSQHCPTLEHGAVSSNAEAARRAAEDASVAAIAGENAAAQYGLQIVAAHIEDDPANRTRFVVLARQRTSPSGRDKTSLILSVPNKAGAVYQMLTPLARHGVSMSRFESRRARGGAWEYWFYVDVEGHEADPKIAVALAELRDSCGFYKSLGSYPVAQ